MMDDDQKNTDLETARGDRSVWLMKCPVVVAKAWNSIPSDSQQNLAKVVVSLDPLRPEDPSSLQFSMEMAGSETVNMPKSYALNMYKDFVPMGIFSEGSQGEGVIDNDTGLHMRPMPGMVGLIASNSKEKKKAAPVKGPEVKRTRRDRGELEDIMFKLFERQPNWALKQLVLETDQPAQFLKEILNELCVYNKRGANQGTYELKPEYKKSVEETGAE
ncbi:hypothetical protein M8C21_004125 [Ambrosia artemisiifolia]|uniref:Transcription initiation factor IIF subunit beta n=1 Tax=Ambrosia artemisiifolia TaxID=4212 RepID=A0AAD5CL68_AMBAR|nr:hypothetical protein M8C21_004125 [Ambrosia artemisiifolia]